MTKRLILWLIVINKKKVSGQEMDPCGTVQKTLPKIKFVEVGCVIRLTILCSFHN